MLINFVRHDYIGLRREKKWRARNDLKIALFCILFILNFPLCLAANLFQIGHASALFSGAIEGEMTIAQLKQYGNFGLGTFNDIQGEMIVLDGDIYQIGQHGKTILANPNWKTPFAEVITFNPQLSFQLKNITNYKQLKQLLLFKLNNKNIPYALQIKAEFAYLKLRSRTPRSPQQTQQIREETYTLHHISGTLVGYWFPEYLLNLTVPYFHFHFISDDKKQSGHVLDLQIANATIAQQAIDKIELQFPQTTLYETTTIIAPTLNTYTKAQLYDN